MQFLRNQKLWPPSWHISRFADDLCTRKMKPFDVGRRASPQPLSPSVTPPSDPCLPQTWQVSNIDHFEHALEKLRRVLEKIDGTTTTSGNVKNEPAENTKVKKPKTRASKLEHKLVEEVYVTSL